MKKLTLNPETIDGHYVTEETKKIWQMELDIYKKFKDICDANGLRYCASSGTLLGVVRHNGSFIPWDDDMDLYMPYKDYCIFKKIAIKELPREYFLQSYETEKGFSPLFCRIRDKRKLMYTEHDSQYPNWNKGVFIDIFPLFNVCDNKKIEKIHRFLLKLSYTLYYGFDVLNRKNDPASIINKAIKCLFLLPYLFLRVFLSNNQLMLFIESIANMYKNKKTKRLMCYHYMFLKDRRYENFTHKAEWFDEMINHNLYDTEIPIPKKYNEVLTAHYGEWNKFVKDGGVATHIR